MEGSDFPAADALKLIIGGVSNGTIKLSGTTVNTDKHSAEKQAENDARYLRVLFAELTGERPTSA